MVRKNVLRAEAIASILSQYIKIHIFLGRNFCVNAGDGTRERDSIDLAGLSNIP